MKIGLLVWRLGSVVVVLQSLFSFPLPHRDMWYPRKPASRYAEGTKLEPLEGQLTPPGTKKKPIRLPKQDLNAVVDELQDATCAILARCQQKLAEREAQIEAMQGEMDHIRGDHEMFEEHLHDAMADKQKKSAVEQTLKQKIEELRTSSIRTEHEAKELQWSLEKQIDDLQKQKYRLEEQVLHQAARQEELEEELRLTKEKAEKAQWNLRIKAQEEERKLVEAHKRQEEKIRKEGEGVRVMYEKSEQTVKELKQEVENSKQKLSKQQQILWHKNKLEEQVLLEQQKNGELRRSLERMTADRDQHAARWVKEREEGAKLAGKLHLSRTVLQVQMNTLQRKFAEQEELLATTRDLNLLDLTLEEALAEMDRMRATTPLGSKLQEIDPRPRPQTAGGELFRSSQLPDLAQRGGGPSPNLLSQELLLAPGGLESTADGGVRSLLVSSILQQPADGRSLADVAAGVPYPGYPEGGGILGPDIVVGLPDPPRPVTAL